MVGLRCVSIIEYCVCDVCVGGLDSGQHLILTFPDVGLKHLETVGSFKELNTTLIYFKSLIRYICV